MRNSPQIVDQTLKQVEAEEEIKIGAIMDEQDYNVIPEKPAKQEAESIQLLPDAPAQGKQKEQPPLNPFTVELKRVQEVLSSTSAAIQE